MSRRRANRSTIANTYVAPKGDPLEVLRRQMEDSSLQAELQRQANYMNTASAREWGEYWHNENVIRDLTSLEDRRTFHPDPGRFSLTLGGKYASVTVHSRPVIARSQTLQKWGLPFRGLPVGLQVPVGIRYAHSFNVINCVRRKVRRAVIFARNKHGKGVKRRKPRRTWRSAIWC